MVYSTPHAFQSYLIMDTPAPSATAMAEAAAAAQDPAPAATTVVDARFCAPEATTFTVAKTINYTYTRPDFTITNVGGAAVMQVEAAVFALQKKSLLLLDAKRCPVVTMEDSG